MKKSLIVTLALVFVLGIAGTAFAANPFVDVPAKHWAYDAVSKLAQAGVVDGYGDGTFRGDKTITRYEMAQIVAKAMTRSDKQNAETKALVDKLAVEFSAELNNLGVRVAKLEANQSPVKVTGDARVRWVDDKSGDTKFAERFRLNLTANVNENTSLFGRIQAMNHNQMGTYNGDYYAGANNGTPTDADRLNITDAAFTTKNFFGTTATVGRFTQNLGQTTYWMGTTGGVDGAKLAFGNDVKVTVGFANFAPYKGIAVGSKYATSFPGSPAGGMGDALFGEVGYNTSKATNISAFYFNEKSGADSNYDVKSIGFTSKVTDNVAVVADYGKNYAKDGKPVFLVARVAYKGAKASVPGSWGFMGEYKKFEKSANDADYTGSWVQVGDVKGYDAIYSVTLAKNIVFDGIYSFNQKTISTNADKDDFVRLQVNFNF